MKLVALAESENDKEVARRFDQVIAKYRKVKQGDSDTKFGCWLISVTVVILVVGAVLITRAFLGGCNSDSRQTRPTAPALVPELEKHLPVEKPVTGQDRTAPAGH